MTGEHSDVAHVRAAFEEFNDRYESLRAGGLDDYFRRFYVTDGVIEHVDAFPAPGRYEGIDDYRRWFDESCGPYEDVRWRIDSIDRRGAVVLALVTATGRPQDEDIELEVHLGITYELEAGRIRLVRVYLGHERAISAAPTP